MGLALPVEVYHLRRELKQTVRQMIYNVAFYGTQIISYVARYAGEGTNEQAARQEEFIGLTEQVIVCWIEFFFCRKVLTYLRKKIES